MIKLLCFNCLPGVLLPLIFCGSNGYLLSVAPGRQFNQQEAYFNLCILIDFSFWFDRIDLE